MSTTTTETSAATSSLQLKGAKKSLLNYGGGESVYKVPTFTDKYAERLWAKQHMAGAFRIFAKLGYADGGAGHISLRDPVNPDHFWINPYAKHFGMITVSDLILIDEDGVAVEPTDKLINTAGFVIHSSLHKARPDVNVAIHTHSPYGKAWSIFGKPIELLTQDSCYLYDETAVYEDFGGAAVATEEGIKMAQALGPRKKTMILQNHGILTCGGSVGEAVAYYIILERACQTQLLAEAAAANGVEKKYVTEEAAKYTKSLQRSPGILYMQFIPEYEMVLKESKGDFLE